VSVDSGSLGLRGGKESVRPTWSSTPQPPAEASAASPPLPAFSPGHTVSDGVWEAGLTSKPHRDRRRESTLALATLAWTVAGRSAVDVLRGPLCLRLASA